MKTTLGGDRLGSGNKQNISLRNYERSTHDLSYLWRSSMAAGTLVPFMNKVALPGDSWDIDLNCEVVTLPTIGPLFGSYKVQLDVFVTPIRLYNAKLHQNKLGIGMNMAQIKLPIFRILTNNHANYVQTFEDNEQVNPSSLVKYLGISGIGRVTGSNNPAQRYFNAVPLLNYWDVVKNYYSNKQENVGYFVHTTAANLLAAMTPVSGLLYRSTGSYSGDLINQEPNLQAGDYCIIQFGADAVEPDPYRSIGTVDSVLHPWDALFMNWKWDSVQKTMTGTNPHPTAIGADISIIYDRVVPLYEDAPIKLQQFDLENIDLMKEEILAHQGAAAFDVSDQAMYPYNCFEQIGSGAANDENRKYSVQFSQEGLAVKTYQSDLFNNWLETEWIDGLNGVNAITAVSTAGDSFTIDALNLSMKVYTMLNRIAVSGGTFDDWLEATYTHKRVRGIESPVYQGSLIKELAFEEVISNADTQIDGNTQPLGTLAGRGRLTGKNKGGKIKIRVDEHSYILGLVSLTPRIDYSQGNEWDVNLQTMDDFHKPPLDAIGFQDLIAEQMLWTTTDIDDAGTLTKTSVGKQPAWINYMTSVNKVFGNFAEKNKEMFMVLNRRYEADANGEILDATTYIDPSKFNHIFAQTSLDSQNFWVQISVDAIARRKMSAKIIPNL